MIKGFAKKKILFLKQHNQLGVVLNIFLCILWEEKYWDNKYQNNLNFDILLNYFNLLF